MGTVQLALASDSWMNGVDPADDTNYGASIYLYNGSDYGDGKTGMFRSILNVDVSSLAVATIVSAKLVREVDFVSVGNFAATVYRCTRPATWVESEVTWIRYRTGDLWTDGGGDYDDTTPTPVGFTEAAATGSKEITGLAGFVEDALASRGGVLSMILRPDDEDPGSDAWVAADSMETVLGVTPYLEVDYTGTLVGGLAERGFLRGVQRGVLRGEVG
jgi:hypothetical protein